MALPNMDAIVSGVITNSRGMASIGGSRAPIKVKILLQGAGPFYLPTPAGPIKIVQGANVPAGDDLSTVFAHILAQGQRPNISFRTKGQDKDQSSRITIIPWNLLNSIYDQTYHIETCSDQANNQTVMEGDFVDGNNVQHNTPQIVAGVWTTYSPSATHPVPVINITSNGRHIKFAYGPGGRWYWWFPDDQHQYILTCDHLGAMGPFFCASDAAIIHYEDAAAPAFDVTQPIPAHGGVAAIAAGADYDSVMLAYILGNQNTGNFVQCSSDLRGIILQYTFAQRLAGRRRQPGQTFNAIKIKVIKNLTNKRPTAEALDGSMIELMRWDEGSQGSWGAAFATVGGHQCLVTPKSLYNSWVQQWDAAITRAANAPPGTGIVAPAPRPVVAGAAMPEVPIVNQDIIGGGGGLMTVAQAQNRANATIQAWNAM